MNSPRRRVTVIGAGYVGLVTSVGLAGLGHTVEVVETRQDRLDSLLGGRVPIHELGLQDAFDRAQRAGLLTVSERPDDEPDVAMICVGTPIGRDGRSDLAQLRSALESVARLLQNNAPLVVRSTLPPGTTRRVVDWSGVPRSRVLTNPEFLRQGTALGDFLHPSRIVIGRFSDVDPLAVELVSGLYDGIDAPRLIVDVAAAELIKNGANAFLALKLSFANELAALSEVYGTDVDTVLDGITRDPRIGRDYMRPSFGFGGSCLPKELQALAVAGRDAGLEMHVTVAASDANAASQARFAERIATKLGGLNGATVGFLGLAFKAGTDDVRDSPAIGVARRLIEGGARVQAHDPEAADNARLVLPQLEIAASPEAALDRADVAVIATEWPMYRDLDWSDIARRLRRPLVIDGRRILDRAAVESAGLTLDRLGSTYHRVDALVPGQRIS